MIIAKTFIAFASTIWRDTTARYFVVGGVIVAAAYIGLNAYVGGKIRAAQAERDLEAAAVIIELERADNALIGSISERDADLWLCRRAGRTDCDQLRPSPGSMDAGVPR